jgi:hypothetical protein
MLKHIEQCRSACVAHAARLVVQQPRAIVHCYAAHAHKSLARKDGIIPPSLAFFIQTTTLKHPLRQQWRDMLSLLRMRRRRNSQAAAKQARSADQGPSTESRTDSVSALLRPIAGPNVAALTTQSAEKTNNTNNRALC